MTVSRAGGGSSGARFSAGTAAPSLLRAWEDGCDASPGERGLLLLRLANPAVPDERLAELSVGERDSLLLDLWERLFGPDAPALADCPACGETVEFAVPLDAIRVPPPPGRPERFMLNRDGHEMAYRLPRAGDLAALGARGDIDSPESAGRALAEQCLLHGPALNDALGQALEAAIAASVAEADPQAVITLDVECPSCAERWQAPFDILEFLWRRLDWSARGLLREVHVLASQYGWSEREIVALTPARRRHYIEVIEG
jgi:hypothetical protein